MWITSLRIVCTQGKCVIGALRLFISTLTFQRPVAFKDWWLSCRERFSGRIRRGFDSFVLGAVWAIGKQWHARHFNNAAHQMTPEDLVSQVLQDIRYWKAAGGGAGGLDLLCESDLCFSVLVWLFHLTCSHMMIYSCTY